MCSIAENSACLMSASVVMLLAMLTKFMLHIDKSRFHAGQLMESVVIYLSSYCPFLHDTHFLHATEGLHVYPSHSFGNFHSYFYLSLQQFRLPNDGVLIGKAKPSDSNTAPY